ncbi:hypothetical protein R1sor_012448 [Riccia sorocarpa]|uniref:HMA domain-containing protein n=1 Tax=Riccia sorocarpa TaxID=122646 RepID=A0ABD3I3T7_9MARC
MAYRELFYGNQPSWEDDIRRSSHSTYYPPPIKPAGRKAAPSVFHVSLCCESCVEKVRKALAKDEGVEGVDVDMLKSKVIVTGFFDPQRVLRRIRKVKKSATFWDPSHDGYENPYSHTAEYDYTDPHAFDESSRSYVHDYISSQRYPNAASYYDFSRDRAPSYYHNRGHRSNGYRSSYDAYRNL